MNYLIVYDHTQISFDTTAIHETITKQLGISDWWHYLPNVYIVTSITSEKELADKIIARHPGLLFVIVNVNLTKYNGVLNKSAWDWIAKKNRTVLKIKPAPQPPPNNLYDLLFPKPSSASSSGSKSGDLLFDLLKGRIK